MDLLLPGPTLDHELIEGRIRHLPFLSQYTDSRPKESQLPA